MSAGEFYQEDALEAAEHIRRFNTWKGVYDSAVAGSLHLDGLDAASEGSRVVINMPGQMYPSVVLDYIDSDRSDTRQLMVTERRIVKFPTKSLYARAIVLLEEPTEPPYTVSTWHVVAGAKQLPMELLEHESDDAKGDELQRLDDIFDEIDEARRIATGKRSTQSVEKDSKVPLANRLGDLIKKYTR